MGVATAPFQIIAGPAFVFVAPTGTSFPVVNAGSAESIPAWTFLGRTSGGVAVKHSQTLNLISTDQNTGPVKAIRHAEGLDIEFSLIDLSLERFAEALNNATVTAEAGPPAIKKMNIHMGRNVAQFAMVVRGDSPYGAFNLQYQVPIVVQTQQPQIDFKEEAPAMFHCTWSALENTAAATEAERFGQIVAQTS